MIRKLCITSWEKDWQQQYSILCNNDLWKIVLTTTENIGRIYCIKFQNLS